MGSSTRSAGRSNAQPLSGTRGTAPHIRLVADSCRATQVSSGIADSAALNASEWPRHATPPTGDTRSADNGTHNIVTMPVKHESLARKPRLA